MQNRSPNALLRNLTANDSDRGDLLSIIRGTLMELFGEYKELHVTEQHWFDGPVGAAPHAREIWCAGA